MLPSRSISRWCAACICLCVCASHSSACHCLLRLLLFLCVSSDSNRGSSLVNCLAVVDTGIVDEAGFTFAKGYSGAGGEPTLCNLPPSLAHIMRQLLLVANLREVCCSAGLSLRQGQRSLCILQRMEEHRTVDAEPPGPRQGLLQHQRVSARSPIKSSLQSFIHCRCSYVLCMPAESLPAEIVRENRPCADWVACAGRYGGVLSPGNVSYRYATTANISQTVRQYVIAACESH